MPPTLHEPVRWPELARRVAGRDPLRMVLLGDSISVGHNASGLYGVPPERSGYGSLLAATVQHWSGTPVDLVNLSVGGMGSEWGLAQMDAVLAAEPDLLLLAFGMNDASAGCRQGGFLPTSVVWCSGCRAARRGHAPLWLPRCPAIPSGRARTWPPIPLIGMRCSGFVAKGLPLLMLRQFGSGSWGGRRTWTCRATG